jgi:hypothetical protein
MNDNEIIPRRWLYTLLIVAAAVVLIWIGFHV